MAIPAAYPFHFPLPTHNQVADPTLSLPSPPQSISSDTFDFDAFTHCSPVPIDELDFENTFGLSPVTSTASSTHLISPKSVFNDYTFPEVEVESPTSAVSDASAAEALSNHHLQRYFHYKNLAAQAESQARAATEQLESLFAAYGMPINSDFTASNQINNNNNQISMNNNMVSFQPQVQQFQPQPVVQPQPTWQMPIQPQSSAAFHAQAQAHMQAHEAAQARSIVVPQPINNYYVAPRADPVWSRQSSSTISIASPPAPATPVYVQSAPIPAPIIATAVPIAEPTTRASSTEGESEITSEDDIKPQSLPLTNLNGGGRGYIPGKTPDDPKKRHKCDVCGRGFARAFNLKSHLSTHDPLRSKPYTCPHSNCRRGFSRLHDLERHRQGIHSDGPLVDAKRQGVSPSVVRAQGRINNQSIVDKGNL